MNKPILLREKGAHSDMLSILTKHKGQLPTIVLHSFVGTFEEATAYLELDNFYISMSGKCNDVLNLTSEIVRVSFFSPKTIFIVLNFCQRRIVVKYGEYIFCMKLVGCDLRKVVRWRNNFVQMITISVVHPRCARAHEVRCSPPSKGPLTSSLLLAI